MMKDYLNNQEVKELLILNYVRVLVGHFTDGNVMSSDEKTNLKKGGTFIKNTLKKLIARLGEKEAKKFVRLYENSKIVVISDSELEVLAKRKDAQLKAAYEDSKEFFDLVEITMSINCDGCSKNHKECSLCNFFDNQEIIPFDENNDLGNCKYSYELHKKKVK